MQVFVFLQIQLQQWISRAEALEASKAAEARAAFDASELPEPPSTALGGTGSLALSLPKPLSWPVPSPWLPYSALGEAAADFWTAEGLPLP